MILTAVTGPEHCTVTPTADSLTARERVSDSSVEFLNGASAHLVPPNDAKNYKQKSRTISQDQLV